MNELERLSKVLVRLCEARGKLPWYSHMTEQLDLTIMACSHLFMEEAHGLKMRMEEEHGTDPRK